MFVDLMITFKYLDTFILLSSALQMGCFFASSKPISLHFGEDGLGN